MLTLSHKTKTIISLRKFFDRIQCEYSSDVDTNKFYLWFERTVLPINLKNDDKYTPNIRTEIYESINKPPDKYYYVGSVYLECYLERYLFTIEEQCKIKKLFKKNLTIANKLGKKKILEYYNGNNVLFITNKE